MTVLVWENRGCTKLKTGRFIRKQYLQAVGLAAATAWMSQEQALQLHPVERSMW